MSEPISLENFNYDPSSLKYLSSGSFGVVFRVDKGNGKYTVLKVGFDPTAIPESEVNFLKGISETKYINPFVCEFYRWYAYKIIEYDKQSIGFLEKYATKEAINQFRDNISESSERFTELIQRGESKEEALSNTFPSLWAIEIEFMNEGNLQNASQKYNGFTSEEFRQIVFQIVYSMTIAEKSMKMIHFDLKPINILVKKLPEEELDSIYYFDLKKPNLTFAMNTKDCKNLIVVPSDFGVSSTSSIQDVGTGSPYFIPYFSLLSKEVLKPVLGADLSFSGTTVSRSYDDDIYAFGMGMLGLSCRGFKMFHREDEVFEGENILQLLHDTRYSSFRHNGLLVIVEEMVHEIRNKGPDSLNSKIMKKKFAARQFDESTRFIPLLLIQCIVNHYIGNGFLPDIRSETSTLRKGSFYRTFEQRKDEILKTEKYKDGRSIIEEALSYSRNRYGSEFMGMMKKCLAFFPEQRSFLGRQVPGYFSNLLHESYFSPLVLQSGTIISNDNKTKIFTYYDDLTPETDLNWMDLDVLPHLHLHEQFISTSKDHKYFIDDLQSTLGKTLDNSIRKDNTYSLVRYNNNMGFCFILNHMNQKKESVIRCNHLLPIRKEIEYLKEKKPYEDLCFVCENSKKRLEYDIIVQK
jgi:hypothetical protein